MRPRYLLPLLFLSLLPLCGFAGTVYTYTNTLTCNVPDPCPSGTETLVFTLTLPSNLAPGTRYESPDWVADYGLDSGADVLPTPFTWSVQFGSATLSNADALANQMRFDTDASGTGFASYSINAWRTGLQFYMGEGDYAAFRDYEYDAYSPGSWSVTDAPEPATATLAGLFVRRFRR